MIKPGDKPKLKAKGAECRYLLPFGAELAKDCCDARGGAHWHSIREMFAQLVLLQRHVAREFGAWDADAAASACRKVCVLYGALHDEAISRGKPNLWDLKPKVHLLQELVEYQSIEHGNPRDFWCYRGESWCGFCARSFKRRGGQNSAPMTAERFLQRYRALENDDA